MLPETAEDLVRSMRRTETFLERIAVALESLAVSTEKAAHPLMAVVDTIDPADIEEEYILSLLGESEKP